MTTRCPAQGTQWGASARHAGAARGIRLRGVARMAAVAAAALLAVVTGANALALSEPVAVTIVDAPRPTPRWGYAPATRRVAAGSWVTWSNAGQDAHTVTAVDGLFDSGSLDPSDGFSWYFDQPGTYAYLCSLHPWMGGTIIVDGGGQPSAISDDQPASDQAPEDDSP